MMLDGQQIRAGKPFSSGAGKNISVALRPEAIALGKGGDNANRLTAKVENVNFLGSIVRVKVRSGTQDISLDMFNQTTSPPPSPGTSVTINFNPDDLVVLDSQPEA
jgi:putative spermidine/putrescine transport system ATP-binding protein